MKYLNAMKATWGIFTDWLAIPIVWVFWPIRKSWLGRNIANFISLARLPLMTLVLTKLPTADARETLHLILYIGAIQLLDGLDGAVARGLDTDGPIGGAIDGGVDKINTVLFIGLLIWELWNNGGDRFLIILTGCMLAGVIFMQDCTIYVNNRRRKLTADTNEKFGSRLPAQIFFISSMLVIAGCWLVQDRSAASWLLFASSILMLFLSAWTLGDYDDDLQRLKRKLAS